MIATFSSAAASVQGEDVAEHVGVKVQALIGITGWAILLRGGHLLCIADVHQHAAGLVLATAARSDMARETEENNGIVASRVVVRVEAAKQEEAAAVVKFNRKAFQLGG